MINDTIAFNNIITSLESTLCIEISGDTPVQEIVDDAIARLENTYSCTIDRDVFSIQAESQLLADSIGLFLKDVQQCLAMLSLYINLKMFHMDMGITLSDVNYLGYSKDQLCTALRYMMYKTEYERHHDDIISPFYNALNNIAICSVKRMFIILLILDKLGISEGVAIVAQFLYLGGLVV